MLTAEQLLDKINKLRKDYADDPEDETFLALHHAFLFMSYQIGLLKEYHSQQIRIGNPMRPWPGAWSLRSGASP